MPEGIEELPDFAESIIKRLGIGLGRLESAPPHILFSNDYSREKIRQEIRGKVSLAKTMLERRLGEVLNLDGRPVIVGQSSSSDILHLEFETVYSGIDPDGKVFVCTNDSNVHDSATLLFMSIKGNDWKIEPIVVPNLKTAYFGSLAEEEKKYVKIEREATAKKE
jgi:hypothetical protein